MAVRLTRREYLSTSATALAATGFGKAEKKKSAAGSIPPVEAVITGDEPRVDFEKYRKIVVSPDVNPPEPFRGFGGYCGWPTVCRLQNGDLFMTECSPPARPFPEARDGPANTPAGSCSS